MEDAKELFESGVPVDGLVKYAVPVGGGTDRPEVGVGVYGWEMRSDPGVTSGPERPGWDVLYPGEAGKVGEHVDVEKRKMLCDDGVD